MVKYYPNHEGTIASSYGTILLLDTIMVQLFKASCD